MRGITKSIGLVAVCLLAVAPVARAAAVELHNVQFPEKRDVHLAFRATEIAPAANVNAVVEYRNGQARVDVTYYGMKPAILFGGDVTCFVVWAVTRDGQAENLGELLTRKAGGRASFSTGKKNFAVMITAESYFLVARPSELVTFTNAPTLSSEASSAPFTFSELDPAPRHFMDGIAHIKWDSKVPLELLQARKALELAERHDAATHAPQIFAEAQEATKSANGFASGSPKSRELLDSARRAVALSNEALNISINRIEALEAERKLAQRRAETEALELRAAQAETAAQEAQRLAAEASAAAQVAERMTADARSEADRVRLEKERTLAETMALRQEKAGLEDNMYRLRQEKNELEQAQQRLEREKSDLEQRSNTLAEDKAALEREAARLREEKQAVETEARRLQQEKDEMSSRLESALSHVAETQDSVRGFVINLPDILFDLNEAELKPGARLILAKLAGILLIIQNQEVLIEGHTDSTGDAGYNLDLSRRRALSVLSFMQSQGLDARRLQSTGFGMERPVADNTTAEGRKRNRRVEIVISEQGQTVASN